MKRARFTAVAAWRSRDIASLSTAAHAADPIKWRVQTALPAASMYMDILKDFARNVDEMSGGRLETEMLPVGAVVGFFEVMGRCRQGHRRRRIHLGSLLFRKAPRRVPLRGSAFGRRQWTSSPTWPGSTEGGGNELYADFIDNDLKANMVAFINLMSGGQPLGWFKGADFEPGGLSEAQVPLPAGPDRRAVHGGWGCRPVALPGGELVPRRAEGHHRRGGVDQPGRRHPPRAAPGLEYTTTCRASTRRSDLGSIIVNKDFWNSLSPDLQAIIKTAAKASVTDSIACQHRAQRGRPEGDAGGARGRGARPRHRICIPRSCNLRRR